MTLNEMAYEIHRENRERGFYDDVNPNDARHVISFLGLIGTEIAETIEAVREPQGSKKLPGFPLEDEEVADIAIRLLDYAAFRGIDLDSAIEAKRKFNATREYRHGGKRA